ncbi:chlorophyllase-1 [Biomphalaria pfeifferi]|uniref:Chlorophyllase-1 n=1 Tax=Biomphalaria pfeifferi TaxID=112525 RepID=A0AAD8BS57_BIOPF|nr:chlorophyllase-1 [Biomphalaria pfeifferi]
MRALSSKLVSGVAFICVVSCYGQNPFTPGQYDTDWIDFSPKPDGIPLHSTVYFPKSTGLFSPILFIGGMYGWASSGYYSILLTELASRGYIVVGLDRYYPGQLDQLTSPVRSEGRQNESPSIELFFNTTQWIKNHLSDQIVAQADWTRTSLLCHSAGCDDTLVMVNVSRTIAKASVFLDPMSFDALVLQPLNSKVKVLASMSQLSEEKPMCCIPGTDYRKIYDLMNCTKVRMQVKDFGHCDIMDDLLWDVCHSANACRTTNNTRLETYRTFAAGVIHGFLQWTIYGNTGMQKYVTNQAYMPLPLVDLAFDLNC